MQGIVQPREISYVADKDPSFSCNVMQANIARVQTALKDMATPFQVMAEVCFIYIFAFFCIHARTHW
jgi:hypothetical protein